MIWLLLMFCIPRGFVEVAGQLIKEADDTISSLIRLPDGITESRTRITYPNTKPCNIKRVYNADGTYQEYQQNQYNKTISLPDGITRLTLVFDSEASLVLLQPDPKKVKVAFASLDVPRKSFDFILPKGSNVVTVQVSGPSLGTVPCLKYLIRNAEQRCRNPQTGNSDKCNYIVEGHNPEISTGQKSLDKTCGRREVVHTELIVNGQPTKPGDWPWHVAISRITSSSPEYICGGTLLSKTMVLTAAHCASISGNAVIADSRIVHLGKHNLIRGDTAVQEREVFKIIIHPEFDSITLNNDIALLKLKSEAVFTDYVQPACLWHPDNMIPTEDIFGTVVGWGLNSQDEISTDLQRITIPIVSKMDCFKSNPTFFNKLLNDNKFCAGFANGTSACNGDSGSGFVIFVPDTPGDASQRSGSWYVRGIVSQSPTKYESTYCDPNQYTTFIDAEKYQGWLSEYLD